VDARCEERGGAMRDKFANLLDESEVFCSRRLIEWVVLLQDFAGFDEIRTFVTRKKED